MPITYNESKDIWELTNPTKQETDALVRIAITEIAEFFGEEMASRIVNEAAQSQLAKKGVVVDAVPQQVEEASAESFQAEGQVGQA